MHVHVENYQGVSPFNDMLHIYMFMYMYMYIHMFMYMYMYMYYTECRGSTIYTQISLVLQNPLEIVCGCSFLQDCMYLHEMGNEEASFTKEDMQAG